MTIKNKVVILIDRRRAFKTNLYFVYATIKHLNETSYRIKTRLIIVSFILPYLKFIIR